MKKVLSALIIAGGLCVTACGPSEADKEKEKAAEQAKLDSISKAASEPAAPAVTDTTATTAPAETPAH